MSLKQCLHKFKPYLLICAPVRKQRLHRNRSCPVFLSLGALCLMNFKSLFGFALSCLNSFLKLLYVMCVPHSFLFRCFCANAEFFFHEFHCFLFGNFVALFDFSFLDLSCFHSKARTCKCNTYLETHNSYFWAVLDSRNVNVFVNTKRNVSVFVKLRFQ